MPAFKRQKAAILPEVLKMLGFTFLAQGSKQVQRGKRETGKWKRVAHTGAESVTQETYRGWQIDITKRIVGLTLRHDQYNAIVQLGSKSSHYLGNYRSKEAALAAAQRHVDQHTPRDRRHTLKGPHRRRPTESNNNR